MNMRCKAIIAIMCVTLMALCPLACMASEGATVDNVDTEAMVKVENLSGKDVEKLFDVNGNVDVIEYEIFDSIYRALFLNKAIYRQSNMESQISDFNYKVGKKYTFTDEKEANVKKYTQMGCNFDLKLNMKNATEIDLISVNYSYEGDAAREMLKEFGNTKVKYGDFIEISGTMKKTYTKESAYTDIVKNKEDNFYSKTQTFKNVEKLEIDVKVQFNDRTYKCKLVGCDEYSDVFEYEIVNMDEKDYVKNVYTLNTTTTYLNYTSDGSITIDGKSYGYRYDDSANGTRKEGPLVGFGPSIISKEVMSDVKYDYNDLELFDSYETGDAVAKAVNGCNGTVSKDSKAFDEEYRDALSYATGKSAEEDNTAWYAVGILVVLIVIAIVLMYFMYRANKN